MNNRRPNRTIIGLTGNIATGKSAVMRMAAEKGALALDADQIVHEILQSDPAVQAAIVDAFGPAASRADGSIDRAALGNIVFGDAEALRALEQIVHPAVGVEIARRKQQSNAAVVFVEAIKLLEGGLAAQCDQIWVTDCTRRRQIERLTICRGMDENTAIARVDAQNPQSAKIARADVVIDTNGTLADSAAQFEQAWAQLSLSPVGAR